MTVELLNLLEKNIEDGFQHEINKTSDVIMNNLDNFQSLDELKKLAYLFEDAGKLKYAQRVYHNILKINNQDEDTLYKLAIIYVDEGDDENAEKTFAKLLKINPNHSKAADELKEIFLRKGDIGLIKHISSNTDDSSLNYYYNDSNYSNDNYEDDNIGNYSNLHIQKFIQLFKSRNDVYAIQWINDNLQVGYKPVHSELTEEEVKKHFDGTLTLGMYNMQKNNKVIWAVIDIDINKSVLNNTNDIEKYFAEIFVNTKKILNTCVLYGIYPIIENSGNKGVHIWFFFETPVESKIVRNFLNKILQESQIDKKWTNYEVFPKQDELKNKELGNLVKLPLGIHKKKIKRGLFVNADGFAFKNQFDYLMKIEPVLDADILIKVIEKSNFKYVTNEDIEEISDISEEPKPNPFLNDELIFLQSKCKVINYLIRKLRDERVLTYEEKLVLIYSVAFIQNGKDILRELFAHCIDFDKGQIFNFIKAVGKNPVSCNKIKNKINLSALKIVCNCDFSNDNRSYPTPVLHLENCLGEKIVYDDIKCKSIYEEYKNEKNKIDKLLNKFKDIIKSTDSDCLKINGTEIFYDKINDSIIIKENSDVSTSKRF